MSLLLGICGSLVLKTIGVPLWIPAVVSGAVIVLYAVITFSWPRIQLEPDQIGDNAYYLGFVLTLTSLAYSLYQLAGQTTETDFIAEVISGFGIALSSTIVGVAVRVFCLQFRLDLAAREHTTRMEINEAARQFRAEMADVIRGTKYLGIELRQSLEEHHDELARGSAAHRERLESESVSAMRATLQPVATELREILEQTAREAALGRTASEEARARIMADLETSLREASDCIGRSLGDFGDGVTASFGKLQSDIDRIETGFGGTLETIGRDLDRSADRLEELTTERIRALETALGASQQAVVDAGVALVHSAETSFGGVVRATEEVETRAEQALETISRGVDAGGQSLKTAIESLAKDLGARENRFSAPLETLEKAVADLQARLETVDPVVQGLNESGRAFGQALDGIATGIRAQEERLAAPFAQLDKSTGDLGVRLAAAGDAARGLETGSRGAKGALTDLASGAKFYEERLVAPLERMDKAVERIVEHSRSLETELGTTRMVAEEVAALRKDVPPLHAALVSLQTGLESRMPPAAIGERDAV
ncbi:hypothetical protein HC022_14090 [Salipiger sp. HF18]|uniref:hypothetical protein n=1 Tax=Salipiger sp. HF18 TaxID=2721557 RepID=UPI00142DDEAE|nr:hypothetical protein [Salipiger sp. HF18]NIY97331.1 hypothetical protein [Salipiger sp. HF18]